MKVQIILQPIYKQAYLDTFEILKTTLVETERKRALVNEGSLPSKSIDVLKLQYMYVIHYSKSASVYRTFRCLKAQMFTISTASNVSVFPLHFVTLTTNMKLSVPTDLVVRLYMYDS